MGGWKREASKMQFFFLSMPWRDFPKSFPNYHHLHVLPLPFCNLCSVHIGPSAIPWTLFALTCLLFPALNMFYIFCLRLTSLNFISLVSLFFFFQSVHVYRLSSDLGCLDSFHMPYHMLWTELYPSKIYILKPLTPQYIRMGSYLVMRTLKR